MKIGIAILVSFVLAFSLGRWTPQQELRDKDKEIKRLQKLTKRGNLGGVGRMLNFDSNPREKELLIPPDPEVLPVQTNAVATATNEVKKAERPKRRRHKRDQPMEEEIERAIELWKTRSDIARNGFLSNIEADAETSARFDTLVEVMNLKMGVAFEEWAAHIGAQGSVRPEDGARLMNEVLSSIVQTYDDFDESFPEGWRENTGSDFKLFDFIDPNVGRPLIEIEGILDESEGRGFQF